MISHPVIQRVSLDLDNFSEWDVYTTVDLLRYKWGLDPAVFKTENGYHVIAYLPPGTQYSFMDLIKIRYDLGDDPKRISHDIHRFTLGYPVDILFTVRRGKHNRIQVKI